VPAVSSDVGGKDLRGLSRIALSSLTAARERKIAAGGRGSGRFAYAQKVPEVVALVRELHGQRQSLRQISKTLAAHGYLTGGGRPYTATAVQKTLRGA
jgi:hypothetical protein